MCISSSNSSRKTIGITLRLPKRQLRKLERIARALSYDYVAPVNRQDLIREAVRRVFFGEERMSLVKDPTRLGNSDQLRLFLKIAVCPTKGPSTAPTGLS